MVAYCYVSIMLTIDVLHMKQTNLRLPEHLVLWIKQTAKRRHQSMNALFITELERLKKEDENRRTTK